MYDDRDVCLDLKVCPRMTCNVIDKSRIVALEVQRPHGSKCIARGVEIRVVRAVFWRMIASESK